MKYLIYLGRFFLIPAFILLNGCTTVKENDKIGNSNVTESELLEKKEIVYRGEIPCNRCDYIELEVILDLNASTFYLNTIYFNHKEYKKDESYRGSSKVIRGVKGDPAAVVYKLSPTSSSAQDYFFKKIGEEQLELIDSDLSSFSDKSNLAINRVSLSRNGRHRTYGMKTTSTADECVKNYNILGKNITVDDVDDYLLCIKQAEKEYGRLTEKYKPIESGSTIMVDVNSTLYPEHMRLNNGRVLSNTEWDILQPILPKNRKDRDYVIDAFSRYSLYYDKFYNSLRFTPNSYDSYVSLRGMIRNKFSSNVVLEFQYYSDSWLFAEKIILNIDGDNIDLGKLSFTRDNTTKIWETTSIPLNSRGKRIAQSIVQGDDVTIRFIGSQYYDDFDVPVKMKENIKVMIKALNLIKK